MQKPAWLTRHRLLIGGGTVFTAVVLVLLIYQPSWTGFGPDSTTNTERDSTGKVIKTIEVGQSGKSLWDWLSVLGVPFSLAVLGFWLQQQEQKRTSKQAELERERTEQQRESERERTEQQAKLEREIASANQREEALQAYFDRLSTLLVDKNLIAIAAKLEKAAETQKYSDQATEEQRELLGAAVDVIRARTLSILRQFGEDGERKSSVIRFLIEAEVINKLNLNLGDANLSSTDLRGSELGGSNLRYSNLRHSDLRVANLRNTNLRYANLSFADLRGVNLSFADLNGADLSNTNLSFADLRGANLSNANLSNANLSDTDLRNSDLRNVNLGGARLYGANLSGANLKGMTDYTETQLSSAKLCKTQLPAGCELNPDQDCEELEASIKLVKAKKL